MPWGVLTHVAYLLFCFIIYFSLSRLRQVFKSDTQNFSNCSDVNRGHAELCLLLFKWVGGQTGNTAMLVWLTQKVENSILENNRTNTRRNHDSWLMLVRQDEATEPHQRSFSDSVTQQPPSLISQFMDACNAIHFRFQKQTYRLFRCSQRRYFNTGWCVWVCVSYQTGLTDSLQLGRWSQTLILWKKHDQQFDGERLDLCLQPGNSFSNIDLNQQWGKI